MKKLLLFLLVFCLAWRGYGQTYCTPTVTNAYASCTSLDWYIHQNRITGESGTALADSAACNGSGYQNFTSSSVTLAAGHSYTDVLQVSSTDGMNLETWIDFNNNGTFETTESVGGANHQIGNCSYTLALPAGVDTGNHRMRTIVNYVYASASYPGMNPCALAYGEVRDYTVRIIDCSPATISGTSTITVGAAATLSASTAGGTWSTSDASVVTVNSSGNVRGVAPGSATISYTITNACGTYTTTQAVSVNPAYCVPNFDAGACAASNSIDSFMVLGEPGEYLHDDAACDTNTYHDRTALNIHMKQGGTYASTIYTGSGPYSYMDAQVWIDFNDNITFESSETVGGQNAYYHEGNFNVGIPNGSAMGVHRMRLMSDWYYYSAYAFPYFDPCAPIGTYGATRDYLVTIDTGCAAMAISAIEGASTICAGTSTTLTCATTGGAWLTGDAAIASVNSATGEVIGIAAGNTTITYDLSTTGCTYQVYHNITTNPAPVADNLDYDYSGRYLEVRPTMCVGGSMYLSIAYGYGTQTITMDPNIGFYPAGDGGYMLPLSAGVGVITITRSTVCGDSVSRAIVTINPSPAALAVSAEVHCSGSADSFTIGAPFCNTSAVGFTHDSNSVASTSVITTEVDNVTLEAWVNWSGNISTHQLIVMNGNSFSDGYGLLIAPGGYLVGICGGVSYLSTPFVLTPGKWQHVALVRNSSVWSVYLDGVQGAVSPATVTPNTPTTGFFVGNSGDGGVGFDGQISQVKFWTTARSSSLVIHDMKSCTASGSDLAAYWSFNETAGDTAFDASGNDRYLELAHATRESVGSATYSYSWNFGDGATESGMSAVHTFTAPGVYINTLTTTTSAGCTASSVDSVTIEAFPVATITGATNLYPGATVALGITGDAGGTWSSSDAAIATVDATTGVVTSITTGIVTISYSLTNSCGSTVATAVLPSYCIPNFDGGACAASNSIDSFMVLGESGDYLHDDASCDTNTYHDRTSLNVHMRQGGTYASTIYTGSGPYSYMDAQVWIDFNDNGTFESSETVGGQNAYYHEGNFNVGIPNGSAVGVHRMRLMSDWYYYSGYAFPYFDPCAPIGTYGATRDYLVTIDTGCAAMAISAIEGGSTLCLGTSTTLTDATTGGTWLTGDAAIASVNSATGEVIGVAAGNTTITYDMSTTGCTYQVYHNISMNPIPVPDDLDYDYSGRYLEVRPTLCVGSSTYLSIGHGYGTQTITTDSNIYFAPAGDGGYMIPTNAGIGVITITRSTVCGDSVSRAIVTINPLPEAGTITGTASLCPGTTSSLSASGDAGGMWISSDAGVATVDSTGTVSAVAAGTASIMYVATNSCGTDSAFMTFTVNPAPVADLLGTASTGPYREVYPTMCVGGSDYLSIGLGYGTQTITTDSNIYFYPAGAGGYMLPLSAGVGVITITRSTVCGDSVSRAIVTINPLPEAGSITGTASICPGTTSSLSVSGDAGGMWISSDAGVATVDSTGTVSAVAAGTASIMYVAANSCGTDTATLNFTVNPLPVADRLDFDATGRYLEVRPTMCVGGSTYLFVGDGYGTQTITSDSGIYLYPAGSGGYMLPTVAGVSTITVTRSTSCGDSVSRAIVTINPLPEAGSITGTASLCPGTTTTLSASGDAGGVWSSADGSIASVSTTGVVTGVSSGTATVMYIVTTSCGADTASRTITINALPNAGTLTGATAVCVSANTAFTASVSGGAWSSSNTSVATVTVGGVIRGSAAGSATISYAVTNSCGTTYATKAITVNPLPNAGTISGATALCASASTTLTASVTGGTWSSIPTTRATISTSGLLRGVTAGADTVRYTVTNGCGSATATYYVTINPLPNAGTLSAVTGLTVGASATVASTVAGGTWALSNYVRASISTSGVIRALAAGSDSAIYTVTNSCGTARGYRPFTITGSASAGVISGPTAVCVGSTITLTSTTGGGSWSSSYGPVASVVSASGVVRGNAIGTVVITYTVGTAISTYPVTVNNSTVAAIAGAASVCPGATTTFTSATSGGTWSNLFPSIGSISATTGVFYGITSGNDSVVYTVVNACGTFSIRKGVTVTAPPSAGSISGALSTICAGRNATFTNSTTGGVWAFSNPTVATIAAIASPSVTVTGMSAGVDTLSYTTTGTCGLTSTVRRVITVNPLPTVGAGATSSMIIGASATLTNTVSGGVWSTVYPTIASVNATTGAVRARAAGLDTIKYKVTNTCGTATAIYLVTVTASKPGSTEMEVASANDIQVYPNPSNGVLTISLTGDFGTTNHSIHVSDATGRLVLEQQETTDKFTIDLSNQASGMYLLRIVTGSQVHEVKVVKE